MPDAQLFTGPRAPLRSLLIAKHSQSSPDSAALMAGFAAVTPPGVRAHALTAE
jgi:hypothetical protein